MPGNKAHDRIPLKTKGWSHLNSIRNYLVEELNIPIALLIACNCPEALVPRKIITAVGLGPYARVRNSEKTLYLLCQQISHCITILCTHCINLSLTTTWTKAYLL